ncbi:hypothetical protein Sste5346_006418 [Sporothrix stenoceras]|uniref:Uncharacterized protein n=1 Tax=Sporothrix stenoceras TaxID=5173 RepID=A0ABR3Z079_9PEZI
MSSIITSDPPSTARTTSPSRRGPITTMSSAATAALGAAAATLRLFGILSDVSLRTAEKGKAVDNGYDSDSSSSSTDSVDLIRGMRQSRRRDYSPETDLALSGLAAYDLPVATMGAYYWYF